jgi:hypothetical protein
MGDGPYGSGVGCRQSMVNIVLTIMANTVNNLVNHMLNICLVNCYDQ